MARHRMLRYAVLLWFVGLFLGWPLPLSAQEPAPSPLEYRGGRPRAWWTHRLGRLPALSSLPRPAQGPIDFTHYPSYDQVRQFCQQWEAEYPQRVALVEIGASWQGRELFIVRLGEETSGDPDARPALYLDAQHHAREPIGQQAALYFGWWLLQQADQDPIVRHLLNTRTVYILPLVNPDGNELWHAVDATQRRTANPACNDDGDGANDEDPAEVSGYGSQDRYRYRFDAAWVAAHAEDILAPGYQEHVLATSYLGFYGPDGQPAPQQDNDGDGQVNEDPVGGVDANRNYDIHWELGAGYVRQETYRGPAPFSEPETQAVRDFVLAHPNIATGVSLHSGVDIILYPWSWTSAQVSPVAAWLEEIARKGSELTTCNGYDGSRYGQAATALYRASGTTVDWLHTQGIYAWSPEIFGGDQNVYAERIGETDEYIVGSSLSGAFGPPTAEILPLVDRWRRFLLYILAATPNLGVTRVAADAENLWLEITNDGYLPVDVALQVGESGEAAETIWSEASTGRRWVNISLPAQPNGTITLTLSATIAVGDGSRTVEREGLRVHWESDAAGGRNAWIEGALTPWVDLASCGNGSWTVAEAAWRNRRYRLHDAEYRRRWLISRDHLR